MLEAILSNRTANVLWEALPRILSAGLTMTIPLTLISFSLAMVLAVVVALVQYAKSFLRTKSGRRIKSGCVCLWVRVAHIVCCKCFACHPRLCRVW